MLPRNLAPNTIMIKDANSLRVVSEFQIQIQPLARQLRNSTVIGKILLHWQFEDAPMVLCHDPVDQCTRPRTGAQIDSL